MTNDRYRRQADTISEIHKQALLGRVMERHQVDPIERDQQSQGPGESAVQPERVPDWFAD